VSFAVPAVTPGLLEAKKSRHFRLNQRIRMAVVTTCKFYYFIFFGEPQANLTALIQASSQIDKPNFINVWHQRTKAAI
jgi:hypothetical protein